MSQEKENLLETNIEEVMDFIHEKGLSEEFADWKTQSKEKEFDLSEKRKELYIFLKKMGLRVVSCEEILYTIEEQDKEFIRLLKEELRFTNLSQKNADKIIDKLAGSKLK